MIHSAVYEWLLSIVVVDNWGTLSWVNLSVSHLVYNLTGTISYSKWVRFRHPLGNFITHSLQAIDFGVG